MLNGLLEGVCNQVSQDIGISSPCLSLHLPLSLSQTQTLFRLVAKVSCSAVVLSSSPFLLRLLESCWMTECLLVSCRYELHVELNYQVVTLQVAALGVRDWA